MLPTVNTSEDIKPLTFNDEFLRTTVGQRMNDYGIGEEQDEIIVSLSTGGVECFVMSFVLRTYLMTLTRRGVNRKNVRYAERCCRQLPATTST